MHNYQGDKRASFQSSERPRQLPAEVHLNQNLQGGADNQFMSNMRPATTKYNSRRVINTQTMDAIGAANLPQVGLNSTLNGRN